MSAQARRLRVLWLSARVAGLFSQRLGGFFAWRLWFTPWRTGTSPAAEAREAAWLRGTTPMAVPFDDGYLSGFVAGEGPTVLLVHGWGDKASRLGALVAPLVAQGFRVVGVDLPAHGASPGRTTNAYEAAAALHAVADHVGGITAVVAHSMGGAETVLALRQGLTVQRVALLSSAVRLEHAVAQFAALFQLPPKTMRGLRAGIERAFGPSVWDDLAADRAAAQLQVPALIVHDRNDDQVAFADGQALASAWDAARFLPTQGLGHHRLLRDADTVAAVVAFVTSAVDADDLQQATASRRER